MEVVKQRGVLPSDPAAAAAIRSLLGETTEATSAEERIEVTRDGNPVAVIAPYAPRAIDRLAAEGRATQGRPFEPRVPSLEWPLDRPTTEIVSEGREDRF